MRRFLIRSGLALAALALLAGVWVGAGPWWAQVLDAVHTTRLASATSLSIRQFSGFFRIEPGRDNPPLPEAEGFTAYDWGNPLEDVRIALDPGGTLVLFDGDRRFVLSKCPGAKSDHGYTPSIAPEPGDITLLTLDRAAASWPTPFHIACCGSLGGGTTWYPWARYLYWHLTWIKPDGARLEMLARFTQIYESGSGWMEPGAAALLRLEIRPGDGRVRRVSGKTN